MKRLLLSAILCSFAWMSQAQSIEILNDVIINDLSIGTNSMMKTATCGPDTVQYPSAKATGFSALSINSATSAQALCQYYNCPQPITISGAEFYAYKIDATGGTSINVNLEVYLAGIDSMPTGLPLASAVVPVDTSFGGGALSVLSKVGTFTPVTMTAPYVVVVSNLSPNGVGMISNDYTAADGQGEWLSSADLFGTWTRSHGLVVGGTPYDADFVVHPIVTYDLTADFTTTNACLTAGPTASFTNTSSPVLFDRMYNQAAYLGTSQLSCTWDYGDASPFENVVDGLHIYGATNMTYNVVLTDTLYGWTSLCTTDTTQTIGDDINVLWSSAQVGSNTNFTDLSTSNSGMSSWLWDFGDGNTSTQQNPTHIYASTGVYTVCLTATTSCGLTDSTCMSVVYSSCPSPTPAYSSALAGMTANFTNSSTVSPPATYLWDFGDGNTSVQSDPSHTYAVDGAYTVCLTVTDQCGTDSTCQTVVISSCATPTADFTITNNDPSFDFTNTSTTTGTTTYSWSMGDGTTFTTADASHTYASNGTFDVWLIVTDSCGVDSVMYQVNVSTIGLDEIDFENIEIYPNPSKGLFTVKADLPIQNVDIIDLSGKLVLRQTGNGNTLLVGAQHLANGQYVVRVLQSDGSTLQSRIEISK